VDVKELRERDQAWWVEVVKEGQKDEDESWEGYLQVVVGARIAGIW
jgi:hypothetical protein